MVSSLNSDWISEGGGTQHGGDHQDEMHQPASVEKALAVIKWLKEEQKELKQEHEQEGVYFGILLESNGKVKFRHEKSKWRKSMTSTDNGNLSRAQKVTKGAMWGNKKILRDDQEIYSNKHSSLYQLVFGNTNITLLVRLKTKELYWVFFLVPWMNHMMSNLCGNLTTHVQQWWICTFFLCCIFSCSYILSAHLLMIYKHFTMHNFCSGVKADGQRGHHLPSRSRRLRSISMQRVWMASMKIMICWNGMLTSFITCTLCYW